MHIETFGVELEGAWWGDRLAANDELLDSFVGDGSLSFSRSGMYYGPRPVSEDTPIVFGSEGFRESEEDWRGRIVVIGEYPSPVFRQNTITDGSFKKWLVASYPDFVNRSCGYHIHLGVPVGTYSAIADLADSEDSLQLRWIRAASRFIENTGIFERATRKAAEERFNGKINFCSSRQTAGEVLLKQGGSRYAHLNFQAYHEHKTLEIRSFPGFVSWQEAFAATAFTLDFFRNLPEEPKKAKYKRLKAKKAKEKPVRYSVSLRGTTRIL